MIIRSRSWSLIPSLHSALTTKIYFNASKVRDLFLFWGYEYVWASAIRLVKNIKGDVPTRKLQNRIVNHQAIEVFRFESFWNLNTSNNSINKSETIFCRTSSIVFLQRRLKENFAAVKYSCTLPEKFHNIWCVRSIVLLNTRHQFLEKIDSK